MSRGVLAEYSCDLDHIAFENAIPEARFGGASPLILHSRLRVMINKHGTTEGLPSPGGYSAIQEGDSFHFKFLTHEIQMPVL